MLHLLIAAIGIVLLIVFWFIAIQRRLLALEENVSNAMRQIGIQISSRFDALITLIDLTKGYTEVESEALLKTIKSERNMITATSTPDEVIHQEKVICDTLAKITGITTQYPELKASQKYSRTVDALETMEKMVRTSCILYNDSVAKMSYEVRKFPISLVANKMGFH